MKIVKSENQLFKDVAELLQTARNNAYRVVSSVMVEIY
jgi:hypothetical protein